MKEHYGTLHRGQTLAPRPLAHVHAVTIRRERVEHPLPYLWFLVCDSDETFQTWMLDQGDPFVPCFRTRDEALSGAAATGRDADFVIGFSLGEVPDLMADINRPFMIVSAVSASGQVEGHYLPAAHARRRHRRGPTRAA